ncbi:riboflavin synthase [Fibrobacterales bacterium]|nr:riboflavin synthase [Fibrobacterales bacterium]
MFTGIIQASGKIADLKEVGDALQMTIRAEKYFAESKRGDSVANNGVCLTIENNSADEASFTLIKQTLENTAFHKAAVGDSVNLELPCRPDSLMGGHFVMGHIDSTAAVTAVVNRETGLEIDLEIPSELSKYVIRRGSIALNGISLTVAEKTENVIPPVSPSKGASATLWRGSTNVRNVFGGTDEGGLSGIDEIPQAKGDIIKVAIVPETIRVTNIVNWKIGTLINVEVDMMGKYIENLLNSTR